MIPDIGIPHFKKTAKQARASQYNFERAINDIIDNVVKLCSIINIKFTFDLDKKDIDTIEFFDNYDRGFENLQLERDKNPFNMGHVKKEHEDDSHTSEFGMGLKYASIFLGNELLVYTRIYDIHDNSLQYFKIKFDFNKMASEKDAVKSYKPQEWLSISKEEYLQNHDNIDGGSTVRLNKIRKETYDKNDEQEFIKNVMGTINDTYCDIITERNLEIVVNDNKIIPKVSYLKHINSKDLVVKSDINFVDDIKNFKAVLRIKYYTTNGFVYYEYVSNKLVSVDQKKYEDFIKNNETQKLHFTSTTTYFIFEPNNKDRNKKIHEENMSHGLVNIYRDLRKYDSLSYIKGGRRNNGSQNYTYHRIDYVSKNINKIIGMNYNKNINTGLKNDFVRMMGEVQNKHEGRFSSDVTNTSFKKMENHAIEKGITNIVRYKEKSKETNITNVIKSEVSQIECDSEKEDNKSEVSQIESKYEDNKLDSEDEEEDNKSDSEVEDEEEDIESEEEESDTESVKSDDNNSEISRVTLEEEKNSKKKMYSQDPTVYWGLFKCDKTKRVIELNEKNMIKAKFGYTGQSPTKRDHGPPYCYSDSGWERQNTYPINNDALKKVTNVYNQSKIQIEIDIYNKLVINNICFEDNSTEVFFFEPSDIHLVNDIIYETSKSYRSDY